MWVRYLDGPTKGQVVAMPFVVATANIATGYCEEVDGPDPGPISDEELEIRRRAAQGDKDRTGAAAAEKRKAGRRRRK